MHLEKPFSNVRLEMNRSPTPYCAAISTFLVAASALAQAPAPPSAIAEPAPAPIAPTPSERPLAQMERKPEAAPAAMVHWYDNFKFEAFVDAYFSNVGMFTARNRLVRFIGNMSPRTQAAKVTLNAMCGLPKRA